MTNQKYTKEEQFLRELAQICKTHKTGIVASRSMTIGKLDLTNIQLFDDGRYTAIAGKELIEGKV